ncbi:MAG TPA: hypothetical protein ENH52_11630, partial [Nitrospirae bacterium]|nr:hypothetical protein [Nitrospirota bacterium]
QYIPWLGYFDKIDRSDCFVFLDQVQYKPREYQNRNKIRTKDGSIWLTVPVISKGMGRQKICDVKIDNSSDWQKRHWQNLKTWYGRAEFFKDHFMFFEELYAERWEKLIDLNVHIINFILKEFKIKAPMYYESELNIIAQKTDRIIEICKRLKADTYLSGTGGRDYLKEDKFAQAGIKLEYQNFIHPTYHQQYRGRENIFSPYMSSIDLLFNEGGESGKILRGEGDGGRTG